VLHALGGLLRGSKQLKHSKRILQLELYHYDDSFVRLLRSTKRESRVDTGTKDLRVFTRVPANTDLTSCVARSFWHGLAYLYLQERGERRRWRVEVADCRDDTSQTWVRSHAPQDAAVRSGTNCCHTNFHSYRGRNGDSSARIPREESLQQAPPAARLVHPI
jgi:hypothetical protein